MFVVLAAVLSLSAIQDTTPSSPATQTPAMTEEEREAAEREAYLDEIVCRRERVTGSNRPERICQTRRQWNYLSDRTQENLRNSSGRTRDDSSMSSSGGR